MLHLNPERLAELADVEPTAQEGAHLRVCPTCARELDAYRSLLALAGAERLAIAPPITDWKDLAAELREEGLLHAKDEVQVAQADVKARRRGRPWLQVAAAVLLAAAGVVGGRLSAGAGLKNNPDRVAQNRQTSDSSARFASNQSTSAANAFVSVSEAQLVLRTAEVNYRTAIEYLALHDTSRVSSADLYRARLAALDAMAGVAQKAVQEIPQDPVINQYYLSATAARAATIAQLGKATGEHLEVR